MAAEQKTHWLPAHEIQQAPVTFHISVKIGDVDAPRIDAIARKLNRRLAVIPRTSTAAVKRITTISRTMAAGI
jgi:hypothetical protein